jgi:hypothetical protein
MSCCFLLHKKRKEVIEFLLINILVLKEIIVENNIRSARTYYGQVTESSRKGPKHEILNPQKGGYRTLIF